MNFEELYRRVNGIFYELQEEIESCDTNNWHKEAKYYNTDLNVVAAFTRALLVEIEYMHNSYDLGKEDS